jgi:uncharacterized membrane protein YhaH (DUF805 family)/ribosomal protein L37AE/L43A
MSANINQRNSPELRLQPEAISLQPRAIICPKCQHQRTAADQGPAWQCPNCGIAYNKATAQADDAVVHKVIRTSGARGRQEIDRGEWETSTPGVISLSLTGRVGRLRYMAYTWPIMALSMLGIAAAVLGPLHKQSPNIPLMILVGVLWFWLWLRLMALRLHDVNRSAKWLLALWLLPAVLAAAGGGQQMIAIGGCLFWVVALLLNVLPGTDGDNDYGPPPGPNTFLVKVGAVLFIAFTALAVVANIKYMQYIRSGKVHTSSLSSSPDKAQDQSWSGSVRNDATQNMRVTKLDFFGTWEGQKMSLRVDNFGNGDLSRFDGKSPVRAFGPLRFPGGNRISIGFGLDPVVLNVTVPPHMEGGVETMTLDGVELVRTGR